MDSSYFKYELFSMLNTKFADINQKYTPPQRYNSYTLFTTERKPLQVINHNNRVQRVPPGLIIV